MNRSLFYYISLLYVALLSFTACGDDDNEDAMPPAACPESFISYTIDDQDYCGGVDVLVANGGGADSYNLNVTTGNTLLSLTGLVNPQVKAYTVGSFAGFDQPFTDVTGRVTIDGVRYSAQSLNPGVLTLTNVDGNEFEGTFSFEAVNDSDSTDRIIVLDGVLKR